MSDKEKVKVLKACFDDIYWMAIRYAHGRHTYAPSTVRDAIKTFKEVFPDWEVKEDKTIEPPKMDMIGGLSLRSDYLDDLFEKP
jgi:hypothetical protein